MKRIWLLLLIFVVGLCGCAPSSGQSRQGQNGGTAAEDDNGKGQILTDFYETNADSYQWREDIPTVDFLYMNTMEKNYEDERISVWRLLDEINSRDGFNRLCNERNTITADQSVEGYYGGNCGYTGQLPKNPFLRICINVSYGKGNWNLYLKDSQDNVSQ